MSEIGVLSAEQESSLTPLLFFISWPEGPVVPMEEDGCAGPPVLVRLGAPRDPNTSAARGVPGVPLELGPVPVRAPTGVV